MKDKLMRIAKIAKAEEIIKEAKKELKKLDAIIKDVSIPNKTTFKIAIKEIEQTTFSGGMLSEPERSGILALHQLIKEQDPSHSNLGLHRITTYTGDYRWLCKHHYDAWQPNIPDVI